MRRNRLDELIRRPQGVFAYGIFDAFSAKMAEKESCEAIYVGGYSAAATRGFPDMGLMTMTEMLEHTKYIARFVKKPLMVDIDDGYGNVNNVKRTVKEFFSLPKVQIIHIEDQKYPKRCGHILGKEIVPLDEFLGKLKAAIKTRDRIRPSGKVMARCDAFSAAGGNKDKHLGGDIEEVIKRLIAYADVGADYLWCEFPSASAEAAEAVSVGVRRVHPNAIFAFNDSPSFSESDWEQSKITTKLLIELVYKIIFSTYPALQASAKAVSDSARDFRKDPIEAMKRLKRHVAGTKAESIMKIVEVDKYLAEEREYYPKGLENQSSSEGFGTVN